MVNLKGKSVVIFGGSGFIGAHLSRRLIAEGASVTIADKISPINFSVYPDKRLNFKRIDITKSAGLKNLLRNKTYVFNLAAAVPFSSCGGNSLKNSIEVNIKGAANIALASVEAGVKKLIFLSGYVVYGIPQYLPVDEKHPTQPLDWYGASKLAAEKYLQVIARLNPDLELVLLRMSSVYGPGQVSCGLIPNLLRAAVNKTSVTINCAGKEKRDYIFIGDAIEAVMLSLKNGVCGIFNIASNNSYSANEIKNIIENLSEHPIKSKYKYKRGLIPQVRVSNNLARKVLGFSPDVSIEDGLRMNYQWYNEKHISGF